MTLYVRLANGHIIFLLIWNLPKIMYLSLVLPTETLSFVLAKSPVFGMINSTLSGLTTIRSSGSQSQHIKLFDDCQVGS